MTTMNSKPGPIGLPATHEALEKQKKLLYNTSPQQTSASSILHTGGGFIGISPLNSVRTIDAASSMTQPSKTSPHALATSLVTPMLANQYSLATNQPNPFLHGYSPGMSSVLNQTGRSGMAFGRRLSQTRFHKGYPLSASAVETTAYYNAHPMMHLSPSTMMARTTTSAATQQSPQTAMRALTPPQQTAVEAIVLSSVSSSPQQTRRAQKRKMSSSSTSNRAAAAAVEETQILANQRKAMTSLNVRIRKCLSELELIYPAVNELLASHEVLKSGIQKRPKAA